MTVPTEYSLQYIADAADGDAVGEKDKRISGVAPFDTADSNQITFAGGSKFLKRIDDTRAGAIIGPKGFASPGKNLIGVNNPQADIEHHRDRGKTQGRDSDQQQTNPQRKHLPGPPSALGDDHHRHHPRDG